MTDVASVAISSSSGLVVRRAALEPDEGKRIPTGSLTVELRKRAEPSTPLQPSVAAYRVSIGASSDSRGARKIADELKKKFFEPVATTFDERQKEYLVLIGQFANRAEAAQFLERLRKSGYESLRIVSDQKQPDNLVSDSQTDTNARTAKYISQPSATAARPGVKPDRRPVQLIALAADKVAASSEDELVVSPAAARQRLDPISRPAASYGKNAGGMNVTQPGQKGSAPPDSEVDSAPPSVRIGSRDYRGEICLVLNPGGRINVVNALPLEDYLRGVVPMELSPVSYPEIEALKAQAVAARSYALNHLGQHRDAGFDLVDDTRAQVYGGLSAERELTNRAIDETRGIAAVFTNEDGKLIPIEALYTANCGGRTENNEEVFGGKPLPYLRGVACAPDRQSFSGLDIVTSRTQETLIATDGRSIAREVALLSVLGFSIPRRPTGSYLSRPPDPDEVRSWIEQTARLTQLDKPNIPRGDGVRLAEFVRLVALGTYGERRASTLLAPADVDYFLGGLHIESVPREARADLAMLLKDGILRMAGDATLDGRAQVTRGQAIETIARAISERMQRVNPKAQTSDSKSQISDSRSQTSTPRSELSESKSQISDLRSQVWNLKSAVLRSEIAAPSDNGRLVISEESPAPALGARDKGSRFTSINTSAAGRLTRSKQEDQGRAKPGAVASSDAASKAIPSKNNTIVMAATKEDSQRGVQPTGLEISEGAWLFRSLGGESHQVDRLTIIGGERVVYHLNARGQVDFLEASLSDRSASSDRFSSVAQWQERVPIEELQQRLSRARIEVGRLEKIEPVSFSSSSRVAEVELTGDERTLRLRRPQIRAALGLKEYLFVVDRETDASGRVVAFVFTGRGWGHGVGMCQTGAYGLARNGYSYASILQKYYSGVNLHKMY